MTVISQETLDLAARHLGTFHATQRKQICFPTVVVSGQIVAEEYPAPRSELSNYHEGYMEVLAAEAEALPADREKTKDAYGVELDPLLAPILEKMRELDLAYRRACRNAIPSRLLEFYDGHSAVLYVE